MASTKVEKEEAEMSRHGTDAMQPLGAGERADPGELRKERRREAESISGGGFVPASSMDPWGGYSRLLLVGGLGLDSNRQGRWMRVHPWGRGRLGRVLDLLSSSFSSPSPCRSLIMLTYQTQPTSSPTPASYL